VLTNHRSLKNCSVVGIQCTKLILALLEPKTTSFVEQVSPTSTEIDDLRTAITVFLQARALCAVIRVRDPWRSADDTAPTVRAEITFVADPHESLWTDV